MNAREPLGAHVGSFEGADPITSLRWLVRYSRATKPPRVLIPGLAEQMKRRTSVTHGYTSSVAIALVINLAIFSSFIHYLGLHPG